MSYAFLQSNEEMKRLSDQADAARHRELKFIESLGVRENARVLEAGCGPGFITPTLATFYKKGRVVACDRSKELLQTAAMRCAAYQNVEFKVEDFCALQEPDKTFDLVYCRLALSHVQEPVKALMEFKRVIKDTGVLCVIDIDDDSVVAEPGNDSIRGLLAAAANKQQKMGGDRYIGRKMASYLMQAGFARRQIQIHPFCANAPEMFPIVEIYTDGRTAYLEPNERQQLAAWKDQMRASLTAGKGFFSFSMFVAIGGKTE